MLPYRKHPNWYGFTVFARPRQTRLGRAVCWRVRGHPLRRYLESHSAELAEKFIREDVQWGLHGKH